jgi:hypothetical protein
MVFRRIFQLLLKIIIHFLDLLLSFLLLAINVSESEKTYALSFSFFYQTKKDLLTKSKKIYIH